MDDLVRELNPFILRQNLCEVLLDLDWICVLGQVQSRCDSLDVRIDDDTRSDAEARTEHDVGSLTGGSGDGEQLLHILRNLSTEIGKYLASGSDEALRFIVEKSGGADVGCQFFLRDSRERLHRWILSKQPGRNLVDAFVSALRGKNGGDEKFPRIGMMESAGDVAVYLVERR